MHLNEYLEVSTGPPSEQDISISIEFVPERLEDFATTELSEENKDITFRFMPTEADQLGRYEIAIRLSDNDIFEPLFNEYTFHLSVQVVEDEVLDASLVQPVEEEVIDPGAEIVAPSMELKAIS